MFYGDIIQHCHRSSIFAVLLYKILCVSTLFSVILQLAQTVCDLSDSLTLKIINKICYLTLIAPVLLRHRSTGIYFYF